MHEGLVTALLWLGFGGTHVGLTLAPVRARLARALGETGFIVFYSFVAIVTFGALTRYVALHRFDDPHAVLLTSVPPVQGALLALSAFGFALFVAGVLMYPAMPMATFLHRVGTPARGAADHAPPVLLGDFDLGCCTCAACAVVCDARVLRRLRPARLRRRAASRSTSRCRARRALSSLRGSHPRFGRSSPLRPSGSGSLGESSRGSRTSLESRRASGSMEYMNTSSTMEAPT